MEPAHRIGSGKRWHVRNEPRRLFGTILLTCAAIATGNAYPYPSWPPRNLVSKRMAATLVGRGGGGRLIAKSSCDRVLGKT